MRAVHDSQLCRRVHSNRVHARADAARWSASRPHAQLPTACDGASHRRHPDDVADQARHPDDVEIEHTFAAEGEAGLAMLGLDAYPAERADSLPPELRRKPVALKAFRQALERVNAKLQRADEPTLILEGLLVARLYTGPLFVK